MPSAISAAFGGGPAAKARGETAVTTLRVSTTRRGGIGRWRRSIVDTFGGSPLFQLIPCGRGGCARVHAARLPRAWRSKRARPRRRRAAERSCACERAPHAAGGAALERGARREPGGAGGRPHRGRRHRATGGAFSWAPLFLLQSRVGGRRGARAGGRVGRAHRSGLLVADRGPRLRRNRELDRRWRGRG